MIIRAPCSLICVFVFLLSQFVFSNGKLIEATADLYKLLETENEVINVLLDYVTKVESKLNDIKRKLSHFQKEHEKIETLGVTEYVDNPINSYLLVKRLFHDWPTIVNNVDKNHRILYDELTLTIDELRVQYVFPEEEDLHGAARALNRLQVTYNLDTETLSEGELIDVKSDLKLSAHDCFMVGVVAGQKNDSHHALSWFREAYRKLNISEDEIDIITRESILENLGIAEFKAGNVNKGARINDELLVVNPQHQNGNAWKDYYDKVLPTIVETHPAIVESTATSTELFDEEVGTIDMDYYTSRNYPDTLKVYRQLCRNEMDTHVMFKAKMRCRYVNNNIPYLFVAPLKEEELYLEPRIVVFHDVIYPNEIETLKNLAKSQLKQAGLSGLTEEAAKASEDRVSKTAFLNTDLHPTLETIRRRVEHMTLLSTEEMDSLQIANYGLAGHYSPHYDFFKKEHVNPKQNNRIATILFYMNNVTQGGATAFPILKVAVWPQEGSAAFWYNLHGSGHVDFRTLHGACPVIRGSKWAANLWIYDKFQEFQRPCDINDAPGPGFKNVPNEYV